MHAGWVGLVLLLLGVTGANCKHRGFILTAPKRLLAGSSENLCLTLHNVTGAAYVEIYLLYPDTDEKITSLKQNVSDTSAVCMKMYIPQTSLSRARLHILAEFDEFPEYRINSVREIHIQHNPLLIFIQTDKPVYRSGQLVRFRVLTLNHKLKPVTQPVPRIWVETPSDVRVAQWLDVVTQHGLVQLELQLSFEPQQGKWKIKVEYDPTSSTHSKIFEVQEYVLPRFEVSIKSPDYILADMSSIQWTICGKYSFGQPVRGTLHVKVESNTPAWRQRTKPRVINLITELDNVEGCFLANVSGSDLGLTDWKIAPSSVILSAHLTEHATNVTANSSSVSPVVHQALKLDFVTFSSHYFKPYLPYSARVKVFHPSGIPAPDETVEVCLSEQAIKERSRKLVVCKNFTSDTDGFVQFVVPPQQQNIVLLSFEAKAVDYQTKYYAANNTWRVLMDQPSSYFDVHAWYSPSHSYITFIPHSSKKIMKCNTINEFKFLFTTKNDQFGHIFYYMVKSRGDLIYFSSTKAHQKYENNTVEEFHNFLSVTNDTRRSVKNETSSDIDSLLYTKQLILNLHIKPEMSPLSYLILYYIHDDGEVVAATHTIQTEMCFENKVTSSFSHQQQVPGLQTMLTIRAAPESLCAVSVVDKRTSYFDSSMRTDYNHAFRELSRFHIDSSSIPHQYDDWEYCSKKQRRKRRSPAWGQRGFTVPPITVYVDAIQAFEEIGVVVLSDLTLETRPCDTLYSHPANEKQTPHQLRLSQRTAKHLDDSGPRTLPDSSPAFSLTEASYSSQSYSNILGYYEHDSYSSMKIRSFFPETWLWDLIYLRDDGIGAVKSLLPHSVTEWVSTILCVSPKAGLGIAPSTSINAFQPFFLDYVLPNSIKRGEVLSLKVVLFNFLTYSLPVKISYSKSISFELLSNDSYASACVAEHSTFFHIYRLKANEIGQLNITVTAEVDSLYPDQCGPELIFNSRDTIVKSIVVKPEGFPVEVMKSSFICPGNFTNDSKLWWNLEIPNNVVEDSARAEISVVGDLLAPSLQNLNHLVRLPMGCGEQNMILFAPNVLVVEYMIATNEINPALKEAAIKNMKTGYQRELNYRHEDGSYSAFGKEDSVGSMWLTAFVVKSFSQARKFIFIDDNSLQVSVEWIVKKQLENGCFPLVGQVFQKDIKGGLSDESSSVALTAYVLISLLETGLTIPPAVTSNALYCLRGDTKPDIYTLAISTYAFAMLGEKNLAIKSLHDLMGNAQVQQDLLWWEKLGNPSTSLSVEITAYVILSLLKIGGTENHPNALKAIRWLSKHRNALGGFISTQDTIVGLEALTKFSLSMPPSVTDMKLQVTAAEFSHTFSLQQQNRLLKQQQHIPVLPTQVVIDAEGDGCAMVQVSVHYNVKTPSGTDSFELDVETGPVSSVDLCTVQRVKACLRYKIPNQASNMAVLEVGMVTGYIPDRASLHTLTNDKALSLRRWEEEDDRVNFYFEEISNKRQCITFLVVQKTEIENPKAAIVKLYDYYSPEISISKKYSTDAGCCNERLPLPQPEISNGNLLMDEQYTNNSNNTDMTELKINFTTSNMQLQTSNTSLEGLNPQFVNVDHDLDVPSGNEGPDPVYALPQSDSLVAIESEDSPSCPICRDSFFENFGSVYCDSFEVYKLTIRKGGNVRLLLDMSPGRPITRIGKSVLLEIENNCKCKPLEKVGNFVILLERKPKVLNTTGDTTPVLKLDSYSYILRAAQRGYSTALRTARESCDLP